MNWPAGRVARRMAFRSDRSMDGICNKRGESSRPCPRPGPGPRFTIDGRVTDTQVARIGEHWAAIARTGDVVVQITARKVDVARVDLERVEDIGPYLRSLGTRRL